MRNTNILQTLCDCNAQTICGLCTIPRPCSNFNCCHTLSSRWQRQWLKRLSVQYLYPSWASNGQTWIHYKSSEVYVCIYKNKRTLFLCQLSVPEYTQSCAIWGTTVYDHIWHFSVCLSHETCVFHLIPSLTPRLFLCVGPGNKATIFQWSIIVHIARK